MRTYHTPGLYVERRDARVLAIDLPRTDIAAFIGIAMRGPVFKPTKVESWTQFTTVFGDYVAQGYLAYAVQGFFANGGRTCWIVRIADEALVATAEFGNVRVSAGSPGSWGNSIRVRPTLDGGEVVAIVIRFPDGSEEYLQAPFAQAQDTEEPFLPSSRTSARVAYPTIPLILVSLVGIATVFPEERMLTGGTDGLATLTPQHYVQALEQLEKIPEIGIVAIPDLMPKLHVLPRYKPWPPSCCPADIGSRVPSPEPAPEFSRDLSEAQIHDLQVALMTHAQALRYRFAILDTVGERTNVQQVLHSRGTFPESNYSALYYPWILVDDPLRLTGVVRAVPPCGHIAGMYARVDQRRGVHNPPMNKVLEAVINVTMPVNDIEHGLLNDEGVNAIRVVPGRGIRVMGGRTLWHDKALCFVNVRRLLSMIELALEQSLQWTVFEMNNHLLYREIDRVVRSFLEDLFRKGMLEGITPEEAYFVQCDKETNPLSAVEQGQVTCLIGIQPPYPAEFVIVTIGITKDGVQVREGREVYA